MTSDCPFRLKTGSLKEFQISQQNHYGVDATRIIVIIELIFTNQHIYNFLALFVPHPKTPRYRKVGLVHEKPLIYHIISIRLLETWYENFKIGQLSVILVENIVASIMRQ